MSELWKRKKTNWTRLFLNEFHLLILGLDLVDAKNPKRIILTAVIFAYTIYEKYFGISVYKKHTF